MENLINYFSGIDSGFRKMKAVTVTALVVSAITACTAVVMAMLYADRSRESVYVIDQGQAMTARIASSGVQKDLETADHVERFHELFFNMAPSSDAIKRNVDKALLMCDRSAYDYWMDLSEKGFYQRLVSANISQQIVIEDVSVNVSVYPYEAKTVGKLYLMRESNITAYDFESTCRLVDVERSPGNPHGLMMERFTVTKNENVGTRKRN